MCVPDSKREIRYYASGHTTLDCFYLWDETSCQWIVDRKETYYYSEHNITFIPKTTEKDLSVYPNPAKEFVVFDLTNISGSAIIEIFDNQGRKVLEQEVSENRQINVSKLARGLNLFRLNYGGKIFTGEIVVE